MSDWVPRLALKPEQWSTLRRWHHVLGALASGSVLATVQQVGAIAVVVTLRTLLQVLLVLACQPKCFVHTTLFEWSCFPLRL